MKKRPLLIVLITAGVLVAGLAVFVWWTSVPPRDNLDGVDGAACIRAHPTHLCVE